LHAVRRAAGPWSAAVVITKGAAASTSFAVTRASRELDGQTFAHELGSILLQVLATE
jgi:hypothetical protein